MGILSWLRGRPPAETKASAAGSAISAWQVGQPVWTPRDYAGFSEEAYRRSAVAFRCIKLIASNAGGASWLLYSGDAEVESHRLLDLLARPGPMIGGAAFLEAVVAYLLIAGNSYVEMVGPDRGAPRELWTLRPDRTRVIAGPKGIPAGYEYEAFGRVVRWQADPMTGAGPILHLKEFNPVDDWYGLSRLEAAAYGVDRHNAASAHNKALLDNGARPSGALIFEPVSAGTGSPATNAPKEIIEAAEARLLDRHGSPVNAGRPMVFGGNVRWEEMGISPRDMDFGAGKDDAARDICLALGVPHVLIVPGSSTYNNVREAKLELWEDTIIPLLDMIVDALNTWLVPRFGDRLRLDYDRDEISALEPRREAKRSSIVTLLDKGVIDEDEARAALQYGPSERVLAADAATINALLDAVQTVGIGPLVKYLKSVRLVPKDATDEDVLAAADQFLEDEGDDDVEFAGRQRGGSG